jgi:hypothetical protein
MQRFKEIPQKKIEINKKKKAKPEATCKIEKIDIENI